MRTLTAVIAITLLVATSWPAAAEQVQNLRGLRKFFLSIEPPSSQSAKCGFTQEWMRARVAPIVTGAGISLTTMQASDAFIEVVVTTLPNCSASLSLEVSAMARLEHSGRRAMVTVWRAGGIGGQEGASITLEAAARELARDWATANK